MYYTWNGTKFPPFLNTESTLHCLTDLQHFILIQLPIAKLKFLNSVLKSNRADVQKTSCFQTSCFKKVKFNSMEHRNITRVWFNSYDVHVTNQGFD